MRVAILPSPQKPRAFAPGSCPVLFDSLQIRDVLLRNRIIVSPMCQYSSTDGFRYGLAPRTSRQSRRRRRCTRFYRSNGRITRSAHQPSGSGNLERRAHRDARAYYAIHPQPGRGSRNSAGARREKRQHRSPVGRRQGSSRVARRMDSCGAERCAIRGRLSESDRSR